VVSLFAAKSWYCVTDGRQPAVSHSARQLSSIVPLSPRLLMNPSLAVLRAWECDRPSEWATASVGSVESPHPIAARNGEGE
jgi:hypothetical protein